MKNKVNEFLTEYKENGVPIFSVEGCHHVSQSPELPLYTCKKCGKQGALTFKNPDYFNPDGFFHLLTVAKNSKWWYHNSNPNIKGFADVIGSLACRDFDQECIDYEIFPIIVAQYLGLEV